MHLEWHSIADSTTKNTLGGIEGGKNGVHDKIKRGERTEGTKGIRSLRRIEVAKDAKEGKREGYKTRSGTGVA